MSERLRQARRRHCDAAMQLQRPSLLSNALATDFEEDFVVTEDDFIY
jgi:hypothetical protein